MGHPDFRAHGRIFVTLQHDRKWGGLMLTPEQQRRLMKQDPASFKPAAGAWGGGGATLVHLPTVDEEALGEAITLSYQNAAATSAQKAGRAGKAARAAKAGPKKR